MLVVVLENSRLPEVCWIMLNNYCSVKHGLASNSRKAAGCDFRNIFLPRSSWMARGRMGVTHTCVRETIPLVQLGYFYGGVCVV